MKKSLRILVVFSIAASSILFATPSHAVAIGAIDISVTGTLTGSTLSANSYKYQASSGTVSANDKIVVTIGSNSFYLASFNENTYGGTNAANAIGVPATPVAGYDATINWIAGYGYQSKGDIYVGGTRVYQTLCPSGNFTAPTSCGMQKNNRFFAPIVQFNYVASTGVVYVRVPVTSGTGYGYSMFGSNVYVKTSGEFEFGLEIVNSWADITNFTIGVGQPSTSVAGAPSSVVATATGKRTATVSFAAPASNGGSAITSYTATSTPGGLTQTLTQATGGTFNFDGLQPGTAYTFAVTATNAIGTSTATTSNSVITTPLVVASLSSLSFIDDGTGTGGKIVWAGKSIDSVLYTGPAASYPGPYNYGAFTSGWNGRIRNLMPGTEYTVSIFAISADGVGESKSLTFKTSTTLVALAGAASSTTSQADQLTTQIPKLFAWIDENVFVDGEGARMKMMLNKFDLAATSKTSAYLSLPNSSVLTVSAKSSTPAVCKVEGQLTVHSIAAGTCTISYTVAGPSKAPVTVVKDYKFTRFAKF